MQLFLPQTLTEIRPCSIHYLEYNMLHLLPQREEHMHRNNHRMKVKYIKG